MSEKDEPIESPARTEPADREPEPPRHSDASPAEEVPFHVPRD